MSKKEKTILDQTKLAQRIRLSNILNRQYKVEACKSDLIYSIFETENPKNWKAGGYKGKQKKKDEKSFSEDHPYFGSEKINAILTKAIDTVNKKGEPTESSYSYSKNFSAYIRDDSARYKVYSDLSPHEKRLRNYYYPVLADFFKKYYTMNLGGNKDGVLCNFNLISKLKTKNAGQSKPYNWEAHHMIPGQVFTEMKNSLSGSPNPIFCQKNYDLLLISYYDINDGHNIIALPTNKSDFFQHVHRMVQHPSQHPKYTRHVIKKVEEIGEKKLKKYKKDEKPCKEAAKDVEFELKDLEKELWSLLIKIGKSITYVGDSSEIDVETVTVGNEGKTFTRKIKYTQTERDLVTYKAESGTSYNPGALA